MPPPDVSRRDLLRTTGVAIGATSGVYAAGHRGAAAQETAGQAAPAPRGSARLDTRLEINGRTMRIAHEARVTLLDLLRERVALTGTKKGCNEGACGACTVLLDGRRVNACMVLAASCDGRAVTTVEGLAGADGALHPVQRAFVEQDALQCGYCTPGQVISAAACIREGHTGSAAEIAEWMSGNICRCAAYPQIVAAVQQAAAEMEG